MDPTEVMERMWRKVARSETKSQHNAPRFLVGMIELFVFKQESTTHQSEPAEPGTKLIAKPNGM
jgi:hypothetical protein